MMKKSNVPWIMGILTLVMLPFQYACAVLCAGAATVGAVATTVGVAGNVSDGTMTQAEGELAANTAAAGAEAMIYLVYISCALILLAGILSFFGKTSKCGLVGKLNLLLSIVILVVSVIQFSIPGILAAIFTFCGSISAIKNAKRA